MFKGFDCIFCSLYLFLYFGDLMVELVIDVLSCVEF